MAVISASLKNDAEQAFAEYSRTFETRVVRRDGWILHPQPLFDVLESGDDTRVQEFIIRLKRGRRELLDAVIV